MTMGCCLVPSVLYSTITDRAAGQIGRGCIKCRGDAGASAAAVHDMGARGLRAFQVESAKGFVSALRGMMLRLPRRLRLKSTDRCSMDRCTRELGTLNVSAWTVARLTSTVSVVRRLSKMLEAPALASETYPSGAGWQQAAGTNEHWLIASLTGGAYP
ncbi:hypothetical protein FKP32DRAFT_384602 [Trametes sanguinea]|nr:hypothetical protein FKP32DRAFT_384602 [Trametes sanguinea]